MPDSVELLTKVRLDKWLWAARFFKTRSLAKQAIDGGKIHINGQRCKPSKDIEVGNELKIRHGWDDKTIIIEALSEKRRGAPEAQALYSETQASLDLRHSRAEERKALAVPVTDGRPTKKQRRLIHRFKEDL